MIERHGWLQYNGDDDGCSVMLWFGVGCSAMMMMVCSAMMMVLQCNVTN
jgi:hypothetical protein